MGSPAQQKLVFPLSKSGFKNRFLTRTFEALKAYVEHALHSLGNYYFEGASCSEFRFLHKIKGIRYDYSIQKKERYFNCLRYRQFSKIGKNLDFDALPVFVSNQEWPEYRSG